MKRKHRFYSQQIMIIQPVYILCFISFLMSSCSLQLDRTTSVYGTITDQNNQPVDSILVVIDGAKFLFQEPLKEVYSDDKGKYEITVEVPKKYNAVDVGIPFGLVDNPKYEKNYRGITVKKDGKETKNCCNAAVGNRTKYDFELIPK